MCTRLRGTKLESDGIGTPTANQLPSLVPLFIGCRLAVGTLAYLGEINDHAKFIVKHVAFAATRGSKEVKNESVTGTDQGSG